MYHMYMFIFVNPFLKQQVGDYGGPFKSSFSVIICSFICECIWNGHLLLCFYDVQINFCKNSIVICFANLRK